MPAIWQKLKKRQMRALRTSRLGREPYLGDWPRLQLRFIDDPHGAMQHYRELFGELDEESADAPLARDPAAAADADALVRR